MNNLYSSISRTQKKALFVAADLIALPLALWSSFALRFGDFWPYERFAPFWWMFLVIPLAGVLIFARLGLYQAVVRFMGQQAIIEIAKGVLLLSGGIYVVAYLMALEGFPRSIPINFAIISALYISATRFLVRGYYHRYINSLSSKEPVLIYGAGGAGTQLALSLISSKVLRPVAFIDDDTSMQGHSIQGLRIHGPADIDALILKHNISRILLAVPSASKSTRKRILERLKHHPVHVQTLSSDNVGYEHLQEVDLDDLLGRDVIPPNEALLSKSISGKVVMVTGAGGSIGSELCRQIIKLSPKILILYENSEFSLFSIENELVYQAGKNSKQTYELVAILGSVQDPLRIDSVLTQYQVDTIFHAAAYKHVSMVEHNITEGIRNNIFGTKVVAEAALQHEVERFILISTDKAVRPTNVMGATKRTAEQVIQVLASKSQSTIFSMVRFGNVLGSSGSVVPLFRKQIEEGGPVTVTHKEITRYFMSIPEASQLVIQAGAMAKGGEVFVLDMGKPVRIYDLAVNMIELSGLEVRDEKNPMGDIAIEFSGLRPGEKLYEELLIGDNVEGTEHPLIMRANEEYLSAEELAKALELMGDLIVANNLVATRNLLTGIVKDYRPHWIVDHLQGTAEGEKKKDSSGAEGMGQVFKIKP